MRLRHLCIAVSSMGISLYAQNEAPISNGASADLVDKYTILIPSLQGVRLLSSAKEVQEAHFEGANRIDANNIDLPGNPNRLDKALNLFWCKSITQEDLQTINQLVIQYYRRHDRPVVFVEAPPQSWKNGILQLVVYESRLGTVSAVGNRYFSSKKLESYVSLHSGDRIKANPLINDLNWINRNPFRTTDLVFTSSKTAGMTDIELITKDMFPVRVYTGVDNTGIAQSGHNRWFAGFNWGNVFGLDHIFTYQFTSGSHYNEMWAHSVNYTAPLSWRHTLDIYGGYSEVTAKLQQQPGLSTHGSSAQASLRYEIPMTPYISILDEFTWGFDWKRTNTGLLNNDQFFFGKVANITQFTAGLNAGLETARTKNSATIEAFASPGQWLPDQQNSHYNDLRAGAKNTYVYTRMSLASIIRVVKDFTFQPTFRAQFSTANLLASEQFGLGGYSTVRGYEEREVNVDNAFVMNLELRTPQLRLVSLSGRAKRAGISDTLIFLGFLDYGYGWNHKLFFNEPSSQHLLGVGPGVRYVMQQYLTVRVDYGFKLHQPKFTLNPNYRMLYFGVVASY